MFEQNRKYDVIEVKINRIDQYLYHNEAIVIDLSNYKRSKIEFNTTMSMFEVRAERELINSYNYGPNSIYMCSNMFGIFVNNQNIVKDENGGLYTVTQLD